MTRRDLFGSAVFAGVLLALLAVGCPSARAQSCSASIGNAFSYDTRVSPRAGVVCLFVVTVYEGASCEAEHRRWSGELGCNEARRMRVTDAGRLVSILAPRASNRLWPIVRVFTAEGATMRRLSFRLVDLPGAAALHGTVRMTFEGENLVMTARDGTHAVAIATLETLIPGS
jgi:hypothetical protein